MQNRQDSLVKLNEEAERLRAELQQVEADRDAQLMKLKEELISQTQQLDGCQARVSSLSKTFRHTCILAMEITLQHMEF